MLSDQVEVRFFKSNKQTAKYSIAGSFLRLGESSGECLFVFEIEFNSVFRVYLFFRNNRKTKKIYRQHSVKFTIIE